MGFQISVNVDVFFRLLLIKVESVRPLPRLEGHWSSAYRNVPRAYMLLGPL